MDKVNTEKQRYGTSLTISLVIHGVLITFLSLSLQTHVSPNALPAAPKGEIIQAVVVDENLVNAEVKRLESEQSQKKADEIKAKQDLAQKVAAAKKERAEEQKKLEKLKQEIAKAKQEEESRLAELKLAKAKEQKQLEELKQKKEAEQKKLAALDDQRQAEQDRAHQMRLEREKEEKRKEDLQKVADAKQKQAAAKRQAALNAARAQAENQQRIMSEAERILGDWAGRVRNNKREAFELPADLFCTLQVTLLPDGNIQEVRVLKTSGNSAYDDLTVHAVYKTQPFDMPSDPAVRDQVKSFELGVRNVEDALQLN